jgi:hypothetical protein
VREVTLSQEYLRNVRERRDEEAGEQERQYCEIAWALRGPEERKVDFEETWAIPYGALITWG